jgi:anti-sigma-K factor RskA
MNAEEMRTKELEQRASAALQESVTRVNSRVRSRLNQARQAALAQVSTSRRSYWRGPRFMPVTGGLAAAALVALVLTAQFRTDRALPGEGGHAAVEDIELLADTEGLDLIENGDSRFYEWAASESEDGDGTSG